jgi:hypothetical protein
MDDDTKTDNEILKNAYNTCYNDLKDAYYNKLLPFKKCLYLNV